MMGWDEADALIISTRSLQSIAHWGIKSVAGARPTSISFRS
jgi:hypothetical protein